MVNALYGDAFLEKTKNYVNPFYNVKILKQFQIIG
jgi:hypothetical protein